MLPSWPAGFGAEASCGLPTLLPSWPAGFGAGASGEPPALLPSWPAGFGAEASGGLPTLLPSWPAGDSGTGASGGLTITPFPWPAGGGLIDLISFGPGKSAGLTALTGSTSWKLGGALPGGPFAASASLNIVSRRSFASLNLSFRSCSRKSHAA